MGSLPTCGDAAAGLQRNFTRTLLPDDARQPKAAVDKGSRANDAAGAKFVSARFLPQRLIVDAGDDVGLSDEVFEEAVPCLNGHSC